MKVKITYTVDMEEVLQEVQRLFGDALSSLEKISRENSDHEFREESLTHSVAILDSMRKEMYGVDLALSDLDGIVRSYMETKLSLQDKQDERELLNG